jgi:leucine dehydrogenase
LNLGKKQECTMPHHKDIFKHAEKLGFGELHFKIDPATQLFAIIAVHNTTLGPAIGGCRWIPYPSVDDAVYDALRLAQGMTLKSAISKLANGGGKAVLMRPEKIPDKEKYFASFARFVDSLGGVYVTAADSGTGAEEMDMIAKHTRHVTSTTAIGNPAIFTARGVLRGIQAAVKHKLQKDSLENIHIAIQGLGHVGYLLAQFCTERGARLTVADVDNNRAQQCAKEFKADIISPERIHTVSCDVYSPCALGAVLNRHTIPEIHAPIIAGAANNQLAEANDGHILHRSGILYAPDFVINAGGVIQASGKYYHASDKKIENKVDGVYDTLMTIFERSAERHIPTSNIADALALEMLEKPPVTW